MNESGISIFNDFKIILIGRKPEILWVDRDSEVYNKTFKILLKENKTEMSYTYSDLNAVFIKRIKSTVLHIINKLMFINSYGNWVNLLNDALVTYNNNCHSIINMTSGDASIHPD